MLWKAHSYIMTVTCQVLIFHYNLSYFVVGFVQSALLYFNAKPALIYETWTLPDVNFKRIPITVSYTYIHIPDLTLLSQNRFHPGKPTFPSTPAVSITTFFNLITSASLTVGKLDDLGLFCSLQWITLIYMRTHGKELWLPQVFTLYQQAGYCR